MEPISFFFLTLISSGFRAFVLAGEIYLESKFPQIFLSLTHGHLSPPCDFSRDLLLTSP